MASNTDNSIEEPPILQALRDGPLLGDGATGSLLFELTGRLSEPNHVYEALNLDNPELVRGVHLAHLHAGARTLKTNTFGASGPALARLGVHGRVEEINRAGVSLARGAITQFRTETGLDYLVFVLGSVGPVADVQTAPTEIESAYGEQVRALIAEGVDALLFETFESLPAVVAVVRFARSLEHCPPVVVHMSLRQESNGHSWSVSPAEYVTEVSAAGASVIGVNCCAPWDAQAFVEAVMDIEAVRTGQVLLSAMPNAGGFERIGHRYMSRVNPEYMGQLARTLTANGARLVGGCCEVHPEHIKEMAGFLRSRYPAITRPLAPDTAGPSPAGPEQKAGNGPFSRKLFAGEFVVSVEMLPPRGTGPRSLQEKSELAGRLAAERLADAVDVTDGSRGIPLMPPGDFIQAVREHLGWGTATSGGTSDSVEFIPHFTSRDLNLMGVQSRLIGYHARRICNVLFVTGDPPKMSPSYPRSTAVFDLDSVRMIELTHTRLNSGQDFGGQPLGRQSRPQTHFTIGTGYEPEALNTEAEMRKLRRKLDAGADYIMTQPVFRWEALSCLDAVRSKTRVLIGVMVLTGLAHARRFAQVPGVHVPPEVFERFAKFEHPEDQLKVGIELAQSHARQVRAGGWNGIYLMSPATHKPVPEVLAAASG
jgi:homocysteine S-methyltransferase